MFLEIVTTITSKVELKGEAEEMSVSHKADINGENAEGFPSDAIYAVVVGACHATINSITKNQPRLAAAEARADEEQD